jgi:hypothetical protein
MSDKQLMIARLLEKHPIERVSVATIASDILVQGIDPNTV